MGRTFDVAVVGAGIAGVATARAVASSGRSVVLLEQFELGHLRGSSHGATRIFRLGYPDERYVRMAQASLDGWRELEEECGRALLVHTGALDIGDAVVRIARALAACGVAFEEPSVGEVADRFGIRLDDDERALLQPDGGTTLADHAREAFLAGARAGGADVLPQTRVRELRLAPRRVDVVTDRQTLAASAVVVTAGAWAPQLLATAGIHLPVVP
ncbi:MAG: FAD-dependent oxidoreductase, partial [Gaiella sp.]